MTTALNKQIVIPPGTHLLVNNQVIVVGRDDKAVFTAAQLIAVMANAQAAVDLHQRVVNETRALLAKNIVVSDPEQPDEVV